jgi:hypothetical protein
MTHELPEPSSQSEIPAQAPNALPMSVHGDNFDVPTHSVAAESGPDEASSIPQPSSESTAITPEHAEAIQTHYENKWEERKRRSARAIGALSLATTVGGLAKYAPLPPTLQAVGFGVSTAVGAYGAHQLRRTKKLSNEIDEIQQTFGG